jgi:hypothetical protein
MPNVVFDAAGVTFFWGQLTVNHGSIVAVLADQLGRFPYLSLQGSDRYLTGVHRCLVALEGGVVGASGVLFAGHQKILHVQTGSIPTRYGRWTSD